MLDRLLEDERLDVEAITGTSAGAMNAAVYAEGYLTDGRAGARRALQQILAVDERGSGVWRRSQRQFFDKFFKGWNYDGSPPIGGWTSSPIMPVPTNSTR